MLNLLNLYFIGSINFKTALEDVNTRKLFTIHSVFLFLMICWTFGSWCRVQIFKRQNSVNLWKYRYRLLHYTYTTNVCFCSNIFFLSDITWWLLTKQPGPTFLLLGSTLSRPWSSTHCSPHLVPVTPSCWPSPCRSCPPSWRMLQSPPTGSTPPTSTSMSSGPQSTCSTGSRGTRKPFIFLATFGQGLEEILWKWL